ncbi:hypothetical protein KCU90_g11, partial [Aureobasidium melanogenum]
MPCPNNVHSILSGCRSARGVSVDTCIAGEGFVARSRAFMSRQMRGLRESQSTTIVGRLRNVARLAFSGVGRSDIPLQLARYSKRYGVHFTHRQLMFKWCRAPNFFEPRPERLAFYLVQSSIRAIEGYRSLRILEYRFVSEAPFLASTPYIA